MNCPHPHLPNWQPNGCGPLEGATRWERMRNKALNKIVPELWFAEACNCHDIGYKLGAVRHLDPMARTKCDREFLLGMLDIVEGLPWYKRIAGRRLAMLYYQAVREGGEKSFNWFSSEGEWLRHKKGLGL